MRVCLWVSGMKVCETCKLGVSESKREFLYNILWVSSREFTTFRVYECLSVYYVVLCV